MRLSTYFTLEELTASGYAARHGISNIPGPRETENLKHTAMQLDRVRALLGCPVLISSGYRSPDVNKAIGMDIVARHLGTTVADAIAFGDGLNDLEMLAHAGIGVGIEGGSQRVLDVADMVAPGPECEGLAIAFAELGLV